MDKISKEVRSRNMAAIRAKDTKPELFIRSLLHTSGYRYRLHKKDLPGKPDLYLKKYGAMIFVHGCFWHQHPNCKYAAVPKSNESFWHPKLRKNVGRDKQHLKELREKGYRVLTIWECEIKEARKTDSVLLFERIKDWLNEREG